MMFKSMGVGANRIPDLQHVDDEGAPDTGIGDTGVDVLSLVLILARGFRRILIVTIGAILIGVLISLLLKPDFTSTSVILPPHQQSSTAAAMGQLGSLFGGGAGLDLKDPADMYVGLLKSRTIADGIIAKYDLMSVYRTSRMEDTRAALAKHALIGAAKDGLIRVSVRDHSAQRASDLANAYIDELYAMNSTLAISEAAQRRHFFDRQLAEEKVALAAAEDDLMAAQQRSGLFQLSGQSESIIRSIAELRAQISSREVQLTAMRTYATDQNPEIEVLRKKISGLHLELNKLQNDQQPLAPGDTQVPASKLPEEGLEYLRKLREVKYHEALFDLLSRQFEAARIDEAESAPIIQVVDRAVSSDRKSGPHVSIITSSMGLLGFLVACLWVLLEHGVEAHGQSARVGRQAARIARSGPSAKLVRLLNVPPKLRLQGALRSPPTVPGAVSDSSQNSHYRRSTAESLAQTLFKIYIVISLALPTGNLMGVNVKYLLFMTLFAVALYLVFQRGMRYSELALLHVIPMILCISIVIAESYGYHEPTFTVIQYSFIATTIVGCWLISLCVPNREIERVKFIRLIIFSMVAIAVAKAIIIGYSFSAGVPIFQVTRAVSEFFHADLMGGELESIGGRIEFVSDIVLPASIFALLFLRKRLGISPFCSVVFVALLTFSSVMSFSRFFWAHTIIAVVLGLTNIHKNKANLVYVVSLVAVGLYYSDVISLLVNERFSAAVAGQSDVERIEQIAALKEFALDAPLLGHGLGTFTNQSVRVWAAPYNYEVQGLALVGQVGFVGVVFLLGLLCLYCKEMFKIEHGRMWYRICLIALFVTAMAGCFFNPYLFSSTASINYGLMAVLARVKSD